MPMRFRAFNGHAANRPLGPGPVETDDDIHKSLVTARNMGCIPERDRDWANRMISAFDEWSSWTERQREVALRIRNNAREVYLTKREATRAASAPAPEPEPCFQKLWAVFNHARERLQKPMLRFKISGGHKVQIFHAPATARFSEGLLVKVSGATVMKIDRRGKRYALRGHAYESNALVAAEVNDILEDLDKDPARAAGDHGMSIKQCVFCARKLTDPRSLAVGYGPDCADNFGLPWGEATTQATEIRCD